MVGNGVGGGGEVVELVMDDGRRYSLAIGLGGLLPKGRCRRRKRIRRWRVVLGLLNGTRGSMRGRGEGEEDEADEEESTEEEGDGIGAPT